MILKLHDRKLNYIFDVTIHFGVSIESIDTLHCIQAGIRSSTL